MQTATDNLGIPPLAGLCSYEDAWRPGLSVDVTVSLLKRYNYVLRRLNEVAVAHIPSTPEWEVKCGLGLHAWLDTEHCTRIRERVAEMREPPLQLDDVPDERLEQLLEETLRAETTTELLVGIYAVVRPAVVDRMRQQLEAANPLFDHPTRRMLRLLLLEQDEMVAWGRTACAAVAEANHDEASAWEAHLRAFLDAAGGVGGDAPPSARGRLTPRWSGDRYEMRLEPKRDSRFVDPYNEYAEMYECYRDKDRPLDERSLALVYMRLREMDVPEYMAPIIVNSAGRDWSYTADLSRQLWDETRHAMMGEAALVREGIPFYAFPIPIVGSATLNLEFTPLEAHLLLWSIEQSLMPRKTGKRYEFDVASEYGDPFLAMMQDYDWADEVLHAQIGRRHLESQFGGVREQRAAAAELMDRWNEAMERMARELSTQSPWWPELLERVRANRSLAAR